MLILSERTILKANRELLELHKRCIVTYLTQKAVKYSKQKSSLLSMIITLMKRISGCFFIDQ